MVDSKPLLKRGGGKIGWSIPNFLVLGNVGSGKSVVAKMLITNIFMENLKKPKQLSPMLIVSEIKQEDWLDFEESSNVFLGWQAHKAIELTYNEMMYRQENKTRKRTPLILLIEEVTVLMSSLEGKQKSKIQKMLKSIILSGRSRSIFCCFVSQDLLSHDGIDTNLRNQFGAVLDLGNMVSRSAISSSIFDLELGQKLSTLPKKHGWYQVFDGSPPIKVKVANIRDIDKVQEVLLEMLNRYQPTEQVR